MLRPWKMFEPILRGGQVWNVCIAIFGFAMQGAFGLKSGLLTFLIEGRSLQIV
jgi:hypothetical protein